MARRAWIWEFVGEETCAARMQLDESCLQEQGGRLEAVRASEPRPVL